MKFISAKGMAKAVMFGSFIFMQSASSQSLGFIKAKKRTISIASYNAENLFDEVHDAGKHDWTYLPLKVKKRTPAVKEYCMKLRNSYYRSNCLKLDWSVKNLHRKLKRLGRVIKTMDSGRSPDIIVFQEVENLRVLKMLRDVALADEGYKEVVLLEGEDGRGIDIGILSKFPLAKKAKSHKIDLTPYFPNRKIAPTTRPILDATFKVYNTKIRVLGSHWPSQSHDDETREIAARTLFDAIDNSKTLTVALGDYNTHPSDKPHGINLWFHDESAKFFFYDSEREAFGDSYPSVPDSNRGTHHYNGKWTSLDKIFVLKNSFKKSCGVRYKNCLRPIWNSFKIIKKNYMVHDVSYINPETGSEVTYYNVPKRFNAETGDGYSDHLPVVMRLQVH